MNETDSEIKGIQRIDDASRLGDNTIVAQRTEQNTPAERTQYSIYVLLPTLFLVVTLLGGLRLGAVDNSFIFLKPALVCLVFAAMLMILFFRSGLITIEGWITNDHSTLQNAASVAILLTLFTATAQLYNSLLPEQGLPLWVIGFCFFWTNWNNLFANFDTKRLLRSLVGLFALAFITKYIVFANIGLAPSSSWWQRILDNPGKEAFAWLLDLPRYSAGTGYIHFVTLVLYLIGLYLIPRTVKS